MRNRTSSLIPTLNARQEVAVKEDQAARHVAKTAPPNLVMQPRKPTRCIVVVINYLIADPTPGVMFMLIVTAVSLQLGRHLELMLIYFVT